jgi:hypothetical protein
MLHIVALLAGLAALWAVFHLSGGLEKFQPELLDRRQEERTQKVEHSSYDQRTNHMPRTSFVEAVQGLATPFRVNAYTAVRSV